MFEDIIGHGVQKQQIENALENKSISHAYLFSGKEGIGKKTFAMFFAKKLLNTDNLEACVDYKYIAREEGKKDISVEQIRKNIIEDIYVIPASGNKKVYIIDDAQTLNKASQNALLKTLEEPPEYVVIILVSNTISSFLPTIISRVNIINFNGVSKDDLKIYILKKYNIELEDSILSYLDGSIGIASNFIENNEIKGIENIDRLYSAILKKEYVESMKISQDIDFSNIHMIDYLEYILYKEKKYTLIKFIEKAKIRLKNNGNYDIVIDNMILKITDNIL